MGNNDDESTKFDTDNTETDGFHVISTVRRCRVQIVIDLKIIKKNNL